MSDTASCHPVRLVRFEATVHALCDGLVRRTATLDAAIATYLATCDGRYVAGCSGAAAAVAEARGRIRALGTWTGDVGRAFFRADRLDLFTMQDPLFNVEGVAVLPGSAVATWIPAGWGDPYLGVGAGSGNPLNDPVSGDQTGPPRWLDRIDAQGELADITGELLGGYAAEINQAVAVASVTKLLNGNVGVIAADGSLVAELSPWQAASKFLWPQSGNNLGAMAKWLQRGGVAVQFSTSSWKQWSGDAGLDSSDRLVRTATRGAGEVAATALAASLGGAVGGAVCGPGAPVCSAVFAVGAGVAVLTLGDRAVDLIPWMTDRSPKPGELDLDEAADQIADRSGQAHDRSLQQINLLARDDIISRPTGEPRVDAKVAAIVPPLWAGHPAIGPPASPPPVGAGLGVTLPPPRSSRPAARRDPLQGVLYTPSGPPTLESISGPETGAEPSAGPRRP